ncbi:Arc family DNA-binding protein [Variovorax sp. DAIF25]|uniref:Arc family DNA-binding protein n=1 Tax=Variovorax sp. DAIF25 TaxID=3080983 RepID=UPI003D6AF873
MEEDRYTRITLRLPRDLHARLDEVADKTSKSLNAEIVGRLEASFGADGAPLSPGLIQELQRIQQLLALNRLESRYRLARDDERAAQEAMAKAYGARLPKDEMQKVEWAYHGARAYVVDARRELEAFIAATPNLNAERTYADESSIGVPQNLTLEGEGKIAPRRRSAKN